MNDFRNRSVSLASPERRQDGPRRAVAPGYAAPVALAAPRRAGGFGVSGTGSSGRGASGAPEGAYGRARTGASARSSARHEGPRDSRTKASQGRFRASAGKQTDQNARAAVRAATGRSRRQSGFMRYAADNRAVQALYGFITGNTKPLFIALVIAAVIGGLYFPVRDFYVARRTEDILSRQVALREAYNDSLQSDVDRYLSQEGIEEAARSELGMVLPGETRIEVTGQDDGESSTSATDGEGSGQDSSDGSADGADASGTDAGQTDDEGEEQQSEVPSTALEEEQTELAAAQDAPWYIRVLDAIFFFDGVKGQPKPSSTTN